MNPLHAYNQTAALLEGMLITYFKKDYLDLVYADGHGAFIEAGYHLLLSDSVLKAPIFLGAELDDVRRFIAKLPPKS